jgi:hypothetical protein
LALLRLEPVDLLLLDWRTGSTGQNVLEEMRTIPKADIPVIMLGSEFPTEKLSAEGLDLRLLRSDRASVAEVLKYLESLVDALPMRGWTDAEDAPPAPEAPDVPPAS